MSSSYILFPNITKALDLSAKLWEQYLETQPIDIKEGNTLYGYRGGILDKSVPITKFCYTTAASDGKAFIYLMDNDISESQLILAQSESYGGEVKTYEWMVQNSYIQEE